MWPRRIELVASVLGGLLGLAALGIGLFAPLSTECVDTTGPSSEAGCFSVSQVQVQGLASLSFAITIFGGLSLGVILYTVWHSLARSLPALVLLWVCTALLYGATLLAILSIGVLFVPADALALLAGIMGIIAATRRRAPVPV